MALIAAHFRTASTPAPDGHGLRQVLERPRCQLYFKQSGVIEAGFSGGSHKTENSFSVVQTDHEFRGGDSDLSNLKEIQRAFQALGSGQAIPAAVRSGPALDWLGCKQRIGPAGIPGHLQSTPRWN